MSSPINKPTGLGYHNLHRKCTICNHLEQLHFGSECHSWSNKHDGRCECSGFCARLLSPTEKRIIKEQRKQSGTKYIGEAWESDFKRDVQRMKIKGIDD